MTFDAVASVSPPHRHAGHSGGQVAIVGCGPSGCYTALALRRLAPEAHITVFDSRPVPFGLIRYGVAPDHQGMKNVSRQFDRLFGSEHVEYVGNTTIGEHLPISALEENFDVVVFATGLPHDRPLTVPVDPAAPVHGAGHLLRLLNGDPDSALRGTTPPARLGAEVLIVGTGNVAMDVARLLCKSDNGFHGSDIDDDAREALGTAQVEHLTVLSRGPRDRVRWDPSMFAELCALPGVTIYFDGEIEERSVSADPDPGDRRVRIDFRFNQIPTAVDTDGGRCVVRAASTVDAADVPEEFVYRADTVVTAMGFVGVGSVAPTGERTVGVGGCSSGTLGNLAENRTLAKAAAQQIFERLERSSGRPGLAGLRELLPSDITTFDDWSGIDRAEVARARPNRVRAKFTTWQDLSAAIARHRHGAEVSETPPQNL